MRKQKKVLILGGIKQMIGVVEAAKRMGFYAIVSDNEFGSSAKAYADKSYNYSPAENAELAKLTAEENIEGIFTAIDDINLWNALKLCKTTGLPMFTSQEQMNMGTAKNKFLEFCRIFNVRVLQERDLMEQGGVGQYASHPHKVKLVYTIQNGNVWVPHRPRLFIKAPAGRRLHIPSTYSREGNKAPADPVFQ